jgi:hypothetical protein
MSKFRALLVSALLATSLVGGAVAGGHAEAKAPTKTKTPIVMKNGGDSWCC